MTDEKQEPDLPEQNILKPVGDLTIFEAAKFHEELILLNQSEGRLELDLSMVERLDSSCIQLIVAATRSGRLDLSGYSQELRNKFEHIGFAQFLPGRQSA